LYQHPMYVIRLSIISIKTNFKQITMVELKCVQYSQWDYVLCMMSSYCFRSFTNVRLLCFVEINESRLSDKRCMIQDVVSPHSGDKIMVRRCTKRSLPNYFDMTSYHWNVRQNTVTWHWWKSGNNNLTSCTKRNLTESIVHILIQPLLFV
jgi:hypothetical protein